MSINLYHKPINIQDIVAYLKHEYIFLVEIVVVVVGIPSLCYMTVLIIMVIKINI